MDLRKVNLNLLVHFDVLIKECSVTRAAQRMKLTQPAMSNILTKLRVLFDDPILVRGEPGLIPSQKSLELIGPIRNILKELKYTLTEGYKFDPKTSEREFTLIVDDSTSVSFFPHIVNDLNKNYPNIKLNLYSLSVDQLDVTNALINEDIELIVGLNRPLSKHFHKEVIFDEDWCCVLRKDHPLAKKGHLTEKEFFETPQIECGFDNGFIEMFDKIINKYKKMPNYQHTVYNLLAPFYYVENSDLIYFCRKSFLDITGKNRNLISLPMPVKVKEFETIQFWHDKTHKSPAHIWLREYISEHFKQFNK